MAHSVLLQCKILRQRIAKMDPAQIAKKLNLSYKQAAQLKSQAILDMLSGQSNFLTVRKTPIGEE